MFADVLFITGWHSLCSKLGFCFEIIRTGTRLLTPFHHSEAAAAKSTPQIIARQVFAPCAFLIMIPLPIWLNSIERRCFNRRRGRRFCRTNQTKETKQLKQTASKEAGRYIAAARCLRLAIETSVSAIVTGSCRSQLHRTNDDGNHGRWISATATGTLSRGSIQTRSNESRWCASFAPRCVADIGRSSSLGAK